MRRRREVGARQRPHRRRVRRRRSRQQGWPPAAQSEAASTERPRRGPTSGRPGSQPGGALSRRNRGKPFRLALKAWAACAATERSRLRQVPKVSFSCRLRVPARLGAAPPPATSPPSSCFAAALTGSGTVAEPELLRHSGRARPPSGVIPHPFAAALPALFAVVHLSASQVVQPCPTAGERPYASVGGRRAARPHGKARVGRGCAPLPKVSECKHQDHGARHIEGHGGCPVNPRYRDARHAPGACPVRPPSGVPKPVPKDALPI